MEHAASKRESIIVTINSRLVDPIPLPKLCRSYINKGYILMIPNLEEDRDLNEKGSSKNRDNERTTKFRTPQDSVALALTYIISVRCRKSLSKRSPPPSSHRG